MSAALDSYTPFFLVVHAALFGRTAIHALILPAFPAVVLEYEFTAWEKK